MPNKQILKSLTNAIADAKTNPVQTITELGTPLKVVNGTVNTDALEQTIDNLQRGINEKAASIVKNLPGGVNLSTFQGEVENAIKNNASIRGAGGVSKALRSVGNMFADYARTYGGATSEDALDNSGRVSKDITIP